MTFERWLEGEIEKVDLSRAIEPTREFRPGDRVIRSLGESDVVAKKIFQVLIKVARTSSLGDQSPVDDLTNDQLLGMIYDHLTMELVRIISGGKTTVSREVLSASDCCHVVLCEKWHVVGVG